MTRLSHILIAAVLTVGLAGAGATLAEPQTPGATAAETGAKEKKKLTKEERKTLREEMRAAKKAIGKMTPEEKAALRSKRQDCRVQGKKEKLKGKKMREFMRTCVKG